MEMLNSCPSGCGSGSSSSTTTTNNYASGAGLEALFKRNFDLIILLLIIALIMLGRKK